MKRFISLLLGLALLSTDHQSRAGEITISSPTELSIATPHETTNFAPRSATTPSIDNPIAIEQVVTKFESMLQKNAIEILSTEKEVEKSGYRSTPTPAQKEWTFIVYLAADNDLRSFSVRNIQQMASIGSTEHLNIFIHLDIRLTESRKITRRYFVEKNRLVHINANDPATQSMNSGDPQTLISCCKQAIAEYPAKNYALIGWNHGTGELDPERGRIINPSRLFTFNPFIEKFELDRSISFMEFIDQMNREDRGVCWDDSTGDYLTNEKLDFALKEITTNLLGGKKFALIGFDACLMSGYGIARIVKNYAEVMVSSQEVELGTGWPYDHILYPFLHGAPTPEEFAQHIVSSYKDAYVNITNDYTQSALNLQLIDSLDANVQKVASALILCLKNQLNNSVKNAIKASRSKLLCTHFEEPSYIDLHHFYRNLQTNLRHFSLKNAPELINIKATLNSLLEEGKNLIQQTVIANEAGSNLKEAKGLSIYFPERTIHPSYARSPLMKNEWLSFLNQYLS